MNLQYVGLNEINGPLVVLDGVEGRPTTRLWIFA